MKTLLLIIFVIYGTVALAQEKNVISVEIKKVGASESMTLNYFTLQDVAGFPKLPKGKNRFYITCDENCVPTLYPGRGYQFTDQEAIAVNEILSRHRVQFIEDGSTIDGCDQFAGRTFPITLTID